MLFKTLIKRLIVAIPTLLAMTFLIFLMLKAVPGDPALLMLGDRASKESLEEFREKLGLNQPWYVQYGKFVENIVVHRDLGRSMASNQPIGTILLEKFPATTELAIAAILFAIFIGIPMGLLAAIKPGTIFDFSTMSVALFGVSMPIFWLGLMLIWVFGLQLDWLPISGRMGIEFNYEPKTGLLFFDAIASGSWDLLIDGLRHIALPAIALGTIPMAFLARMTRSSMLEVIGADYVRTAKAKGVSEWAVVLKHTLKNAAIPILTVLGLQFGALLGGAIITETVFAWPGIGSWLLESVNARDYPAVQGGILVTASAFVFVNLAVDMAYRLFDPRMRVN